MRHLGTALEDHALIDTQAGGKNVATKDRGAVDFNPMFGADVSADFAADDHGARVNCALDARSLADNEGVRSVDFASKDASDAESPLKAELPFELATVFDNARDRRVGGRNMKICGFAHA